MSSRVPLVAAATCAVLGSAYVLWSRRRNKSAGFRFDAPLPSHIKLPDDSVQSGVIVELGDEYRKLKMRHLVMSSAISPAYLKALLPIIKELFVPQKVCAVRQGCACETSAHRLLL